jgi:hypothetical protein
MASVIIISHIHNKLPNPIISVLMQTLIQSIVWLIGLFRVLC